MLPVIFTIFFLYEIIHIHQELWRSTCTGKHAAHHEHHVNKATTERFQIGRCRRVATNRRSTAYEPRIHGDRGAVIGKVGFIVLINKVMLQLINILIGQILTIHFLDAICEQTAVQTYETTLGQLTNQRGNVFVLHIGIGIKL